MPWLTSCSKHIAYNTRYSIDPTVENEQWVFMERIAIMFGLAFGTVLTMLVVPVLYAFFFKVDPSD